MPIVLGLVPVRGELLRCTLSGLEPAGTFTWRDALAEAGPASILTGIGPPPSVTPEAG